MNGAIYGHRQHLPEALEDDVYFDNGERRTAPQWILKILLLMKISKCYSHPTCDTLLSTTKSDCEEERGISGATKL
ncbi:unnamed protein product [Caenorhabditis angaria]|uniref:Uncharacterized protein n=1 Tax=Caenorhabditis angaria TaxID=860376 RepID=A0A9P1J636_9PELO|nr:unnamed protein product [Caenorhabditis angaria]